MAKNNDFLVSKLKKLHQTSQDLFGDAPVFLAEIQKNLAQEMRYYQKEALQFLDYTRKKITTEQAIQYPHLLFQMATGAGKTLSMASMILYLYQEHQFQNFIFFVHTDAILQKTRDNLLTKNSSKYLFNKNGIEINGNFIEIKEVDVFPKHPASNTIYLKLTTIHKLHDDLTVPAENRMTLEDLNGQKLVLLGDEAHHFNAETKEKSKKNQKANQELSWERSIMRLLQANQENILLEFTATIDLSDKSIASKYKDKLAYQYDLTQFMQDGFSKNVMLLRTEQDDKSKMLDAILLSQYRKLVAVKNGILNFKPIVMFKTNKIDISKKKQFEFEQIIANLSYEELANWLSDKEQHFDDSVMSIWKQVVRFYRKQDLIQIVAGIQNDFQTMNLFNANSSDLLESNPRLLNTLEASDNPIRAIFAVAKLNEGWDVLNLYDIVRISENASTTTNSTDSEAQLIGRGARYYPFMYDETVSLTRRFDNANNELAILETLHYHTINETGYIKNLQNSLKNADIIFSEDTDQVLHYAKIKNSFKETNTYKNEYLYINKVVEIDDKSRNWDSYSIEKTVEKSFKVHKENNLNDDNLLKNDESYHTQPLKLDLFYYRKAIQRLNFYTFKNLKKYFPSLKSIDEFILNRKYLSGIDINVKLPNSLTLDNLSPKEKLSILEDVLNDFSILLRKNYSKNKGTKEFIPILIKEAIIDYELLVHTTPIKTSNGEVLQSITSENMMGKTWYVFDNAILNQLEHRLVQWVGNDLMKALEREYTDVYLLRNNERNSKLKLVEFNGVRGFYPDFFLILRHKETHNLYQILLEPKGENLIQNDKWKEKMLLEIKPPNIILSDCNNQIIYGTKFYTDTNTELKNEFLKDIEIKLFGVDSNILTNLSQKIQQSLF